MGLFDLPAPLFAWLDGLLAAAAPATVRLALWGLVGAALSMALYWLLSSQQRMTATRVKALEARRAVEAHDGDFAAAWPLIREMLRLALGRLRLALWPAVAASMPLLCLLTWLSTAYGYSFPALGADVDIEVAPPRLEATWMDEADLRQSGQPGTQPPRIRVTDPAGRVVADVALPQPVPILHKHAWWNVLFGNPAGYLPDGGEVNRVDVALPRREYLPFGPSWLRGWEAVFFAALLAGSLFIKVGFRVE